VVGSLWVLSEAIPRLAEPQMPEAVGMIGLAVLGIVVNGLAAYRLSGGRTLNERVLNWHLLEDVLGWVAVLIVSLFPGSMGFRIQMTSLPVHRCHRRV